MHPFKILPCRKFLGSKESYDDAKIILFSVPMDHTESFRPGSRFAPSAIRDASDVLEEFSLSSGRNINDIPFYDWGELEIPHGDLTTSLGLVEDVTTKILKDNRLPAVLGGEHLITYPVIKALKKMFHELVVFHIDAHLDLRDSFSGMTYSHATVMRRVVEVIGLQNLYQFGIRSGTKEEWDLVIQSMRTQGSIPLSKTGFEEAILMADGRPIYVTLDMDVIDPAFAPGVGTPEPGGFTSRELLEALSGLWTQDSRLNIVGFDLVEVSPPYDPSSITAILGAKLVRDLLFLLDK
jgi:agmatinase